MTSRERFFAALRMTSLPVILSAAKNLPSLLGNQQVKRVFPEAVFYSLIKTYVVPTLFGMKACGMARAMPCVARQPVQWAGNTTAGLSCCRAAIVWGMIG